VFDFADWQAVQDADIVQAQTQVFGPQTQTQTNEDDDDDAGYGTPAKQRPTKQRRVDPPPAMDADGAGAATA
jgi:hypothetical protein